MRCFRRFGPLLARSNRNNDERKMVSAIQRRTFSHLCWTGSRAVCSKSGSRKAYSMCCDGKPKRSLSSSFNHNNNNLRLLNKSLFDAAQKCPRLGWFSRRSLLPSERDPTEPAPMKDFLIREGMAFEEYVCAHKYGHRSTDSSRSWRVDHGVQLSESENNGVVVVVEETSPTTSAVKTRQLLLTPATQNIFEGDPSAFGIANTVAHTVVQPTFLSGNLVARADVAVRMPTAAKPALNISSTPEETPWEIVEIKSSSEKSYRRKIPDLAFTVHVARSAGYRIDKASLIVVNPNYVLIDPEDVGTANQKSDKNNDNLLYTTIDCTDLVNEYIVENDMAATAAIIDKITGGEDDGVAPPVAYKLVCGKCELLGIKCGVDYDSTDDPSTITPSLRSWKKHPIWELPRLTEKRFPKVLQKALPSLEIADLDLKTPEEEASLLTQTQIDFRSAVLADTVVVKRSKLKRRLEDIQKSGPRVWYLDFEAVSTLRPPYPGMSPYETMVTQYSLHHHDSKTTNKTETDLSHNEYLADPKQDCRRTLLEDLLSNLGYNVASKTIKKNETETDSAILVYSSYEKTQLRNLAELFPEYSAWIREIIDHRLVDLEKILKDCVFHPEFRGRSSIKVTLPALVPGFETAYENLEGGISDGGTASASFAQLISGSEASIDGDIDRTKKALLDYCRLDTLALVEIHKALWNLLDEEDIVFAPSSLEKRTVSELKSILKDRGLKVTGKKATLIERLLTSNTN